MAEQRRHTAKKTIEAETSRRGRSETAVKIRKEKRKEHLNKKRRDKNTNSPDKSALGFGGAPPATGFGQYPAGAIPGAVGPDTPDLELLKKQITGPDRLARLDAIKKVRKLLSKEEDPPARQVIQAGLVPILIQALGGGANGDGQVQFEAAWALTNIASTEFTREVVDRGAVQHLALLMKSVNADVREQSCWCLGNVAGDGPALRDVVLNTPGCLANLLLNITHASSGSMRRNATWALSNFCRGKPQPDIEAVRPALGILNWLIKLEDAEILRDACWAFSYISDGDDERIQVVIEQGPVPTLIQLLGHESTSVVTPALRTIGNVISGSDDQTQHALDARALEKLVPLLSHDKKNVRKEACWTLSNIAAGTCDQAERLVQFTLGGESVIEKVVKLALNGEWEVMKEAAWILANICTGGNVSNIQKLVDSGALSAIVLLLAKKDVAIVLVALEALEAVLRKGQETSQAWHVEIEEVGGQDYLEKLYKHDNDEIYQRSVNILRRYYEGASEEEDGGMGATTEDGNAYAFHADDDDNDMGGMGGMGDDQFSGGFGDTAAW